MRTQPDKLNSQENILQLRRSLTEKTAINEEMRRISVASLQSHWSRQTDDAQDMKRLSHIPKTLKFQEESETIMHTPIQVFQPQSMHAALSRALDIQLDGLITQN